MHFVSSCFENVKNIKIRQPTLNDYHYLKRINKNVGCDRKTYLLKVNQMST